MAREIPSYDSMYGSEYLNPTDLNGKKVRVIFVKAEVLELRCQNQKATKIVMTAKTEDDKPCHKKIAINKTSAKQLAVAWGKPTTAKGCPEWLGKLAEISHAKVQAFGAMKDCCLVSPLEGKTAATVVHDEDPLDDLPDEPGSNG